jgi:hypothetical protein
VFWDAQALTTEEFSHTNGNLIDLEEDGVTDESIDINLVFNIRVATAFTGLTEGCYIAIVTSDSATFASGNVAIVALGAEDAPILPAVMTAGAGWTIACQPYGLGKYLGVLFEPISTAASAGALDVYGGLASDVPPMKRQKAPDGYTIA